LPKRGLASPQLRGTILVMPQPRRGTPRAPSPRPAATETDQKGLHYGPRVVGKHLFRIREHHVADHLIPLMRRKALGAVKLDLILRGIALQERHRGERQVGTVLPAYSWIDLHDLARPRDIVSTRPADIDESSEVRRLKRKWVGDHLATLEELRLMKRVERPGKRPQVIMLCDDGQGGPLDDPDGTEGNWYVTIHGGVISTGALARWGTAETSGYLAAMVAERNDDAARELSRKQPGMATWFRSLGWFADKNGFYGPPGRIRLPFSESTLDRGFKGLETEGLLYRQRIVINPRTGQPLQGPRIKYTNRFGTLVSATDTLEDQAFAAAIESAAADADDE
jgi:hypothetical protein